MDKTNFPKKSPRSLTNHERASEQLGDVAPAANSDEAPSPTPSPLPASFWEEYFDRSFDMVARVRAAKERAQRAMEEFGDPSEYDVFVLRGGKWVPAAEAQASTEKSQQPTTGATSPQDSVPSENQDGADNSESQA